VRRTCIWCNKEVGLDPDDQVWFHSKTGKVQCADGVHDADPLEPQPLTGGRLVWLIVGGIVLAVVILTLLFVIITPSECERRAKEIEVEIEAALERANQSANLRELTEINEELERLEGELAALEATC
jgi:hypothetical protein